jgi:hypothetical protein
VKPVRSRFKPKPRKARKPVKKINRSWRGLPKAEVTRRLKGMGASLRDPDTEITLCLDTVDDFLAAVRQQPCCLCGSRQGCEAHHVRTRGARNPDFYNVIPACYGPDSCHSAEHSSRPSEEDLEAIAITVTVLYLIDHPEVEAVLRERGLLRSDVNEAAA